MVNGVDRPTEIPILFLAIFEFALSLRRTALFSKDEHRAFFDSAFMDKLHINVCLVFNCVLRT